MLFFALIIAAGMVMSLSACGKKGELELLTKKEVTEKTALGADIPLPNA